MSFSIEPLVPFGALLRSHHSNGELPNFSLELRELLLKNRLLVLRDFAPFATSTELASYAQTFGALLNWSFGSVFEVVERPDASNYLFTSGSVPFHWDGAFAEQVPWLQVFQCVEAPGQTQGGETVFSDTASVWRDATPETQSTWQNIEIEYRTEKVAHYGGCIKAALVDSHPLTHETVLRFNEPANAGTVELNTPEVNAIGLSKDEQQSLFADLCRRLYDPRYAYAHTWHPGDVVIADNFVLLHGRLPYQSKAPRRLWRAHVLSV